jgi:hypothetical protein
MYFYFLNIVLPYFVSEFQQNIQPLQCHQVRYIVHLTLSRKERPHSIRTTHIIIINKNTAMIVSLTPICCPSDLKKERTSTKLV